MTNRTMNTVKGIGASLAIGAALGMAGSYVMSNKKSMAKKGRKAMKTFTGIMDSMQNMF